MMSSSDSSPSATGHDGLPDFDAAHRLFTAVEENDTNDPSNSGAGAGGFPQIAGYVIDRLLGAGGGGTVYRAVRAGSEHTVAIKLLNRRLGAGRGAPEAQRAWRELHLLSQLRLPCLPHVHDYDEHEGRLYIVTDYVDGLPLAEYCEEHKLDCEARVKLLAAVADCVQTLHEHGVIHRDVKPANVIINPHGQPIIIDLGIAALLTDDVMETLTAEGAPIGSPAFMAPEQARGERDKISTRSDVYSLGATAYYILTGEPPHDMTATIHEAVRRVAQDDPRDPRELDRTLPKPLASVLWKAVSPKPADRYASAAGLAADPEALAQPRAGRGWRTVVGPSHRPVDRPPSDHDHRHSVHHNRAARLRRDVRQCVVPQRPPAPYGTDSRPPRSALVVDEREHSAHVGD